MPGPTRTVHIDVHMDDVPGGITESVPTVGAVPHFRRTRQNGRAQPGVCIAYRKMEMFGIPSD